MFCFINTIDVFSAGVDACAQFGVLKETEGAQPRYWDIIVGARTRFAPSTQTVCRISVPVTSYLYTNEIWIHLNPKYSMTRL